MEHWYKVATPRKTVGLLINFNVPVLKHGIKRIVLNYNESSASSASLR